MIHPTAVVAPGARLGPHVEVGAYAVVGSDVVLGPGCKVMPHAVLQGVTHAGEGNVFHPFSVVGGPPQARRRGTEGSEVSGVVVGHGNVFREHVTVHAGTTAQGTRIGDENLLMVGCHVAHDVTLGSHVTLANGVQLAGHVVVEDHATFGGVAAVAQFVRVGESAFVAGGAMCERDVPPFVIVQGDRARVRALNVVGLRRRGVPEETLHRLRAAFRALYVARREDGPRALPAAMVDGDPLVGRLVAAAAAAATAASLNR